jgi:hypothetical protein
MQDLEIALSAACSPDMSAHPPRYSTLLEFKERLLEVMHTDVMRSVVNFSLFLWLAVCRMRSSVWDTLTRFCARRVLCSRISLCRRPWLRRLRIAPPCSSAFPTIDGNFRYAVDTEGYGAPQFFTEEKPVMYPARHPQLGNRYSD